MKIISYFVLEIKKLHRSIHDICKIWIVYVQLIPLGNLTVGEIAQLVNINITLCFWIINNKRSLNKRNEFQIMLMIFFCLRVYQILFLIGNINYRSNTLFNNVLGYEKISELTVCFVDIHFTYTVSCMKTINIPLKFSISCIFFTSN